MANPWLARFASVPVLLAPDASDIVSGHLTGLASSEHAAEMMRGELSGDGFWDFPPDSFRAMLRPYVVRDGVLLVPVKGVLLHDFPYAFGGMATGYHYIWKAVERGAADPMVKGIAFVIDSPGGEVAGCFDLVDKIWALRSAKPMRAFAAEIATSAAYAIASAAQRIIAARTSRVGSIGVVTPHVDMSKAAEDRGLKVTFVFAGAHKVDGNPFEPLPANVKARIQAMVDHSYGIFVATVARNRQLSEQAVRATEALTYTADEAVANGLADGIGAFDEAVAAFAAELDIPDMEDEEMTTQNQPAFDQAAVDTARSEGETAGRTAGAAAERQRVAAIMALDEAANRREAAFNIALHSDMAVEQAKGLLAKLPEDKPAAETTEQQPAGAAGALFNKAMEQGNPELGAGNGGDPERSQLDTIIGDYRAITGAEKRAA